MMVGKFAETPWSYLKSPLKRSQTLKITRWNALSQARTGFLGVSRHDLTPQDAPYAIWGVFLGIRDPCDLGGFIQFIQSLKKVAIKCCRPSRRMTVYHSTSKKCNSHNHSGERLWAMVGDDLIAVRKLACLRSGINYVRRKTSHYFILAEILHLFNQPLACRAQVGGCLSAPTQLKSQWALRSVNGGPDAPSPSPIGWG